jgi:hypothetical protein
MLQEFLTRNGSVCILQLQEVHLSNQFDIYYELDLIIDEFLPTEIQLNLQDIQKVNSTAIGRLVYLKRYVEEEKALKFSIDRINPQTLKTLKAVKVDGVLEIGN